MYVLGIMGEHFINIYWCSTVCGAWGGAWGVGCLWNNCPFWVECLFLSVASHLFVVLILVFCTGLEKNLNNQTWMWEIFLQGHKLITAGDALKISQILQWYAYSHPHGVSNGSWKKHWRRESIDLHFMRWKSYPSRDQIHNFWYSSDVEKCSGESWFVCRWGLKEHPVLTGYLSDRWAWWHSTWM